MAEYPRLTLAIGLVISFLTSLEMVKIWAESLPLPV
jgi:hypothetical protein